jgi:hypothetical protein
MKSCDVVFRTDNSRLSGNTVSVEEGLGRDTKSRRVDSWLLRPLKMRGAKHRLRGSPEHLADDNARGGGQGVEETAFTGCTPPGTRRLGPQEPAAVRALLVHFCCGAPHGFLTDLAGLFPHLAERRIR